MRCALVVVVCAAVLVGVSALFWNAHGSYPDLRTECESKGGTLIRASVPARYLCVKEMQLDGAP